MKSSTITSMKPYLSRLLEITIWFTRFAAAYWLLIQLAPAGPRAPLGPPQTVETLKPHVCVHTRLIDEVDEWKIQRSLQVVREMGAQTIVEFFPWAYIESEKGQYRWEAPDLIIRHASNQGLHVIARLGLVPAWARETDEEPDTTTLNTLPPEHYPDFADFVAAFAARYAGTIGHIIIWNEPNLSFEWGYNQVDPAGYVRLLEAVYPAAHQANPSIIILAAPLAPTLEPPGSPNGLNDLLYLDAMYRAGAARFSDALAIHTYGFTEPPEAAPNPQELNFRRAELLHEILQRYAPDTPVYITETGWNDHPRWANAVRPSLRIAFTIDALRLAEQNWPWAQTVCIWALRYPAPTRSYPDYFTLITPDFNLKPIYYAIQAYARGWQNSDELWLSPPEDSQ